MKKEKTNPRALGESTIHFGNFHESTRGEFIPCLAPQGEPDFISPSGSVYWDMSKGVIRASDHWAGMNGCTNQASCVWSLLDTYRPGVWAVGYCDYANLAKRRRMARSLSPSQSDLDLARLIIEGRGYHVDFKIVGPCVPVWARLHLPGSLIDQVADLFSLNKGARRILSADLSLCLGMVEGEQVSFGTVLV